MPTRDTRRTLPIFLDVIDWGGGRWCVIVDEGDARDTDSGLLLRFVRSWPSRERDHLIRTVDAGILRVLTEGAEGERRRLLQDLLGDSLAQATEHHG